MSIHYLPTIAYVPAAWWLNSSRGGYIYEQLFGGKTRAWFGVMDDYGDLVLTKEVGL